jgi:CheY-like chemotaxis protein
MKKMLMKEGALEVVTVSNGEAALVEWSKKAFDVSFIDYHMGVDCMNGSETCRAIRKEHKDAKLVVVTAGGIFSEPETLDINSSGCLAVLRKPLVLKDLVISLEGHHVLFSEQHVSRTRSFSGFAEQKKTARRSKTVPNRLNKMLVEPSKSPRSKKSKRAFPTSLEQIYDGFVAVLTSMFRDSHVDVRAVTQKDRIFRLRFLASRHGWSRLSLHTREGVLHLLFLVFFTSTLELYYLKVI